GRSDVMRLISLLLALPVMLTLAACDPTQAPARADAQPVPSESAAEPPPTVRPSAQAEAEDFDYETERFADVRILRYRVPGFESLDLETKKLLYYLYEAALESREIIYDQKHAYNLAIKRTLEEIAKHYPGDRDTES